MSKRPSPHVATIARKNPRWHSSLPQSLRRAVEEYHIEDTSDFAPLGALSASTLFEGIEVHGEAAVVEDGQWIAPADIYVTLVYDPNGKDRTELHDSYPAKVYFSVGDDDAITVSNIDVDVRSFYGPGDEESSETAEH